MLIFLKMYQAKIKHTYLYTLEVYTYRNVSIQDAPY